MAEDEAGNLVVRMKKWFPPWDAQWTLQRWEVSGDGYLLAQECIVYIT
jgi:hypothetical protein